MNPFWEGELPDPATALSAVRDFIMSTQGATETTEPVLDFIDAVLAKHKE